MFVFTPKTEPFFSSRTGSLKKTNLQKKTKFYMYKDSICEEQIATLFDKGKQQKYG